jgi:UDP-N-acetyl-D-mannosaminuronate dehydrogenase
MLHSPGISVGGHCIPVYPQMYLQSHPSAEIVSLGRRINSDMPERALSLLSNRMGDLQGKRILVSGLSYRTGVKERAFSGGEELSMVLTELGAECFLVDELFTPSEILNFGFDVPDDSPFDALVINSGTRNFQLSLLSMLKQDAFILDGRSVLSIDDWSEVIQIGEGF